MHTTQTHGLVFYLNIQSPSSRLEVLQFIVGVLPLALRREENDIHEFSIITQLFKTARPYQVNTRKERIETQGKKTDNQEKNTNPGTR